jgi:hypothetical protein
MQFTRVAHFHRYKFSQTIDYFTVVFKSNMFSVLLQANAYQLCIMLENLVTTANAATQAKIEKCTQSTPECMHKFHKRNWPRIQY